MLQVTDEITDNPKYRTLAALVKRAGLLDQPEEAFMGLGQFADPTVAEQLRTLSEFKGILKFEGLRSLTLDPEVALSSGAHALLHCHLRTGLKVPGDALEILQWSPWYRVVKYSKSPEVQGEPTLEIFELEEVLVD